MSRGGVSTSRSMPRAMPRAMPRCTSAAFYAANSVMVRRRKNGERMAWCSRVSSDMA
jgi:hypothetical protein